MHSWRYTCASEMLEMGVPHARAAEWIGDEMKDEGRRECSRPIRWGGLPQVGAEILHTPCQNPLAVRPVIPPGEDAGPADSGGS